MNLKFKKIDIRRINVDKKTNEIKELNIYFTPDKREIVYYDSKWFYLSKDGLKLTTRQVKINIKL